jgi:hypothetical protein
VADLELLDLGHSMVDFGRDARPGQFAVVKVGEHVEERLQVVLLAQLQLAVGAHAGEADVAGEGVQAVRVLADGDDPGPAEAHQPQLPLRSHQAARLDVLVQHFLRMHSFHDAQQLQRQIGDFPQRVGPVVEPFSNQLHLHKAAAAPLAELHYPGHSRLASEPRENVELMRKDHFGPAL